MITGQSVLLRTDNATVVAYLQNEGGTKSESLNRDAIRILEWCTSNDVELAAQHVPWTHNVRADALSRGWKGNDTEWELAAELVTIIFFNYGPSRDRPVATRNAKCSGFVTRSTTNEC